MTLTGLAAGCPDPNPLYRFLLRSPSGVWSTVRDYSPTDTFAWHTSTYAPGTYQIGVWVKDSLSGFTYDAYALASFILQSKPCAGVEVEPGSPSPKVPGDIINFVAIAGGCPDPQYRWLVRNPAGVWSTVAAYSASDSFSWNTTGRPSGTYQVGVWARQKGSNESYETYGFVTYVLRGRTTAACQAVDLPANGISPSVVGTIFDFTAAAFGCTPQYKWLIRDPSGHWAVVRNYSSSDTYTWNTASHAAGTYQIGVWVRRTGSIAAYEAYYTRTLTLVAAHNFFICTSAGVLSGASSPQAPGALIIFTAGASGCISPEFKFLILAPGATTWTVVQPYGSNTFVWNTAGLSPGTWQVGVWARQVGSTASYQAYALLTFQLTFV